MNEWISIKDESPPVGELIKIKAEYSDEDYCEGKAIFNIYDIDEITEAWKWDIKEGYNSTLKPTHWMPLKKNSS